MPAPRREASDEVPLQITVPRRIKHELDVRAAETGRTKRAIVLEALRAAGFEMTDDEVAGRRGRGRER
ncbi:MAG: hypothetical protein CL949_15070 [Erythrobacter sp.]|nr:hypothetical protein [Erythrobacter sp.]|tara:strand:- start:236 stop:439 length:204 start_codon:yes stop_codon:yes gene_type:complete